VLRESVTKAMYAPRKYEDEMSSKVNANHTETDSCCILREEANSGPKTIILLYKNRTEHDSELLVLRVWVGGTVEWEVGMHGSRVH